MREFLRWLTASGDPCLHTFRQGSCPDCLSDLESDLFLYGNAFYTLTEWGIFRIDPTEIMLREYEAELKPLGILHVR